MYLKIHIHIYDDTHTLEKTIIFSQRRILASCCVKVAGKRALVSGRNSVYVRQLSYLLTYNYGEVIDSTSGKDAPRRVIKISVYQVTLKPI